MKARYEIRKSACVGALGSPPFLSTGAQSRVGFFTVTLSRSNAA